MPKPSDEESKSEQSDSKPGNGRGQGGSVEALLERDEDTEKPGDHAENDSEEEKDEDPEMRQLFNLLDRWVKLNFYALNFLWKPSLIALFDNIRPFCFSEMRTTFSSFRTCLLSYSHSGSRIRRKKFAWPIVNSIVCLHNHDLSKYDTNLKAAMRVAKTGKRSNKCSQ